MASFIKTLDPFISGSNVANSWSKWKNAFKIYETACEYDEKAEKVRIAFFKHVAGEEVNRVCDSFIKADGTTDKDLKTLDLLIAEIDKHFSTKKRTALACYEFYNLSQKQGQSTVDFIKEVKIAAEQCNFGDQYENQVIMRVTCGVQDMSLRQALIREANLTLSKLLDFCQTVEVSRSNAKQMQTTQQPVVEAINKTYRSHNKDSRTHTNTKFSNFPVQTSCIYCGSSHPPRKCPAYGKTCRICHKQNHFDKMCRSKHQKSTDRARNFQNRYAKPSNFRFAHSVGKDDSVKPSDYDTRLNLGELNLTVNTLVTTSRKEWLEEIIVNGYYTIFKLDPGSEVNILPLAVIQNWQNKPLIRKTKIEVGAYGGSKVSIAGETTLSCTVGNMTKPVHFVISTDHGSPILGLEVCESFNLVTRNNVSTEPPSLGVNECKATLSNILHEYEDVFTGIGRLPGVQKITLHENAVPKIIPARSIPVTLEPLVKAELQNLEAQGIISKVTEPTEWVSPLVIVEKKDNKIRICLDPKYINEAIKREHYHLPTVENILAKVGNAKYFTLLDAKHAFYHLTLDDESSKVCTFASPFGRFKFNVVPFGISSAPELFQREIDRILGGIQYVHTYFDDVLIATEDLQSHEEALRQVLLLARENNLKLNKEKTQLAASSVSFLGHTLSTR